MNILFFFFCEFDQFVLMETDSLAELCEEAL
jgi:hypothetical protein